MLQEVQELDEEDSLRLGCCIEAIGWFMSYSMKIPDAPTHIFINLQTNANVVIDWRAMRYVVPKSKGRGIIC